MKTRNGFESIWNPKWRKEAWEAEPSSGLHWSDHISVRRTRPHIVLPCILCKQLLDGNTPNISWNTVKQKTLERKILLYGDGHFTKRYCYHGNVIWRFLWNGWKIRKHSVPSRRKVRRLSLNTETFVLSAGYPRVTKVYSKKLFKIKTFLSRKWSCSTHGLQIFRILSFLTIHITNVIWNVTCY